MTKTFKTFTHNVTTMSNGRLTPKLMFLFLYQGSERIDIQILYINIFCIAKYITLQIVYLDILFIFQKGVLKSTLVSTAFSVADFFFFYYRRGLLTQYVLNNRVVFVTTRYDSFVVWIALYNMIITESGRPSPSTVGI